MSEVVALTEQILLLQQEGAHDDKGCHRDVQHNMSYTKIWHTNLTGDQTQNPRNKSQWFYT
jgi:hypothetical protein